AFGCGQQHLRFAQLRAVVLEARDLEGFVAVEAMAARRVRGFDAGPCEGHDLAAEQAENTVQWAHPGFRTAAPAHRRRPRELVEHGWHDLGDDLACRAAGLLDPRDVEVALL